MNPLFAAAVEVQNLCRTRSWGSCLIGGIAVLRWGEPRLTRDVDLTVLAELGAEEVVVDGLLGHFNARIDDARRFALRNRVLLLRASNGVPVDIALGALDFEHRAVERASWWDVDDARLLTCSAEDLVVHKAFADRERDWLDIEGVLIRQRHDLDRELVLRELTPLVELKGNLAALDRLRALFD